VASVPARPAPLYHHLRDRRAIGINQPARAPLRRAGAAKP